MVAVPGGNVSSRGRNGSQGSHVRPFGAKLYGWVVATAGQGRVGDLAMRMHYNGSVLKKVRDSTYAGRYLFVVAIAEGDEAFIVTARDMTDAEKRTFRRKAR